jgi:hypothetical protein
MISEQALKEMIERQWLIKQQQPVRNHIVELKNNLSEKLKNSPDDIKKKCVTLMKKLKPLLDEQKQAQQNISDVIFILTDCCQFIYENFNYSTFGELFYPFIVAELTRLEKKSKEILRKEINKIVVENTSLLGYAVLFGDPNFFRILVAYGASPLRITYDYTAKRYLNIIEYVWRLATPEAFNALYRDLVNLYKRHKELPHPVLIDRQHQIAPLARIMADDNKDLFAALLCDFDNIEPNLAADYKKQVTVFDNMLGSTLIQYVVHRADYSFYNIINNLDGGVSTTFPIIHHFLVGDEDESFEKSVIAPLIQNTLHGLLKKPTALHEIISQAVLLIKKGKRSANNRDYLSVEESLQTFLEKVFNHLSFTFEKNKETIKNMICSRENDPIFYMQLFDTIAIILMLSTTEKLNSNERDLLKKIYGCFKELLINLDDQDKEYIFDVLDEARYTECDLLCDIFIQLSANLKSITQKLCYLSNQYLNNSVDFTVDDRKKIEEIFELLTLLLDGEEIVLNAFLRGAAGINVTNEYLLQLVDKKEWLPIAEFAASAISLPKIIPQVAEKKVEEKQKKKYKILHKSRKQKEKAKNENENPESFQDKFNQSENENLSKDFERLVINDDPIRRFVFSTGADIQLQSDAFDEKHDMEVALRNSMSNEGFTHVNKKKKNKKSKNQPRQVEHGVEYKSYHKKSSSVISVAIAEKKRPAALTKSKANTSIFSSIHPMFVQPSVTGEVLAYSAVVARNEGADRNIAIAPNPNETADSKITIVSNPNETADSKITIVSNPNETADSKITIVSNPNETADNEITVVPNSERIIITKLISAEQSLITHPMVIAAENTLKNIMDTIAVQLRLFQRTVDLFQEAEDTEIMMQFSHFLKDIEREYHERVVDYVDSESKTPLSALEVQPFQLITMWRQIVLEWYENLLDLHDKALVLGYRDLISKLLGWQRWLGSCFFNNYYHYPLEYPLYQKIALSLDENTYAICYGSRFASRGFPSSGLANDYDFNLTPLEFKSSETDMLVYRYETLVKTMADNGVVLNDEEKIIKTEKYIHLSCTTPINENDVRDIDINISNVTPGSEQWLRERYVTLATIYVDIRTGRLYYPGTSLYDVVHRLVRLVDDSLLHDASNVQGWAFVLRMVAKFIPFYFSIDKRILNFLTEQISASNDTFIFSCFKILLSKKSLNYVGLHSLLNFCGYYPFIMLKHHNLIPYLNYLSPQLHMLDDYQIPDNPWTMTKSVQYVALCFFETAYYYPHMLPFIEERMKSLLAPSYQKCALLLLNECVLIANAYFDGCQYISDNSLVAQCADQLINRFNLISYIAFARCSNMELAQLPIAQDSNNHVSRDNVAVTLR